MPDEGTVQIIGTEYADDGRSVVGSGKEKRTFERIELIVPGRLFDKSTEREVECQIIDMSAGGVGISCLEHFNADVTLVLYIGSFGRFEGSIVSHGDTAQAAGFKFGMRFNLTAAKRQRVIDMLASFVQGGLQAVTNMRATRRVRTNGVVEVRLCDDSTIQCELIDISLDGVAVRTPARPPIGVTVRLGETVAQVVRHHDTGIAMRFLRPTES